MPEQPRLTAVVAMPGCAALKRNPSSFDVTTRPLTHWARPIFEITSCMDFMRLLSAQRIVWRNASAIAAAAAAGLVTVARLSTHFSKSNSLKCLTAGGHFIACARTQTVKPVAFMAEPQQGGLKTAQISSQAEMSSGCSCGKIKFPLKSALSGRDEPGGNIILPAGTVYSLSPNTLPWDKHHGEHVPFLGLRQLS